MNTYEAEKERKKFKVFELEERIKKLSCKKGCFVVSLQEMCRSEAGKLLSGESANSKRPANSDSLASAPIVGGSFDEAKKQDELYSRRE